MKTIGEELKIGVLKRQVRIHGRNQRVSTRDRKALIRVRKFERINKEYLYL